MRSRVVFSGIILLFAILGCGRKLPPLPPALPDPVEIGSLRFEGAVVEARARCNVDNASVMLLGKPKGICPHCTDDLSVKGTVASGSPGEVVLRDQAPQSDQMVYRIAVEYGDTKWMTPVRIVVKP